MRGVISAVQLYRELVNSPVPVDKICPENMPPSIYATRILSPTEHLVCLDTYPIEIEFSDIALFRKLEIYKNSQIQNTYTHNDIPIEYINTTNNTISISDAISCEGFYRINVYSGNENTNASAWNMTTHSITVISCNEFDGNYSQAQWYFDKYVSLDFRNEIAQLQSGSNMNADMSESSICDDEGNLLFYTDGIRIWNSQHGELTGLPGERILSKSTIALKFSTTKYAIFTTTESGSLTYRIITINNTNTPISSENVGVLKTVTFDANVISEGISSISVVPTLEDGKYWLLSATKGNIAKPVVMKVGITNNGLDEEITPTDVHVWGISIQCDDINPYVNSINVSPTSEYVVYCGQGESKFLRFNAVTGELIDRNCNFGVEKKSDAAFSPSGRFLYMSCIEKQKIVQYDLHNISECDCPDNYITIFEPSAGIIGDYTLEEYQQEFGTIPSSIGNYIQEGPDGKIYFSVVADNHEQSRTIGIIRHPEAPGSLHNNNECGVTYPFIRYESASQYYNHINLPNFVDAINLDTCKVNFNVCSNNCETIKIENMSVGTPTLYTWTFVANNVEDPYYFNGYNPNIDELNEWISTNNISQFTVSLEKLSQGCENTYMEKTISLSPTVISITGPQQICNDGNDSIFSVTPTESLVSAEWSSPLNGQGQGFEYSFGYSGENNDILLTAVASNIYGCISSASLQVDVSSIDYSAVAIGSYCNSGQQLPSVQINISSPGVYNFVNDVVNVSTISGNSDLCCPPPGYYTFEISNDVCHYRDSVEITYAYDIPAENINVELDCTYPLAYTITISDVPNAFATIQSISGRTWASDNNEIITIRVSNSQEESPEQQSSPIYLPRLGIEEIPLSIKVIDNDTECENIIVANLPLAPYIEFLNDDCEDAHSSIFVIHNVNIDDINDISITTTNNLQYELLGTYINGTGLVYELSASSCDELTASLLYIYFDECPIYQGSARDVDPITIVKTDFNSPCKLLQIPITGGIPPYSIYVEEDGGYTQSIVSNQPGENIINIQTHPSTSGQHSISISITSYDMQHYTLFANIEPINILNDLIAGNNSFNNEIYYVTPQTNGLTFDHDVTFTNCTFYCAYTDYDDIEQTQWAVNSGKILTFENCTIKSACPDKMWKGIKIDGDASNGHSSTSMHGKVVCTNNTKVEDAIKALESIRGGIIQARECYFLNNKYDLYYNTYRFTHDNSSSPISKCTFSTTRLLNDNSIFPDAHIYMDNVYGIYIDSCTFENTIPYSTSVVPEIGTPYYTDCRGIGIKTNMSNFYTSSINSFNNLYYGVYVNGFYSSSVKVLNSTFTDNYRGIYVNSNPGCIIRNNSIAAYPGSCVLLNTSETVKFGVYIESCTAFTFEENNISNFTTGMYVNNTGTSANKIRYNTFTGATNTPGRTLLNALIVTGVNSDYISGNNNTGGTGLEILCNNFNGTNYDIGIKDGYMRRYQGSSNAPTGNQFLATGFNSVYKYQFHTQFSPSLSSMYDVYQYDYYQHDDTVNTSNYVRELQSGHYSSRVTPRTILGYNYTDNYCQCNRAEGLIESAQVSSSTISGIISTMAYIQQLRTTLNNVEIEFKTKLDGGNTDNALMKVLSISSHSAPIVNDLSYNGYLSDTVYNALVAKVEENPAYVTSVFIENSPLPTKTYNDVLDTDISQILKTVLSYYQLGENARVADEKVIGNISQEISINENILYNMAINDSLAENDYITILDYFASKDDIYSKTKAYNILMSEGKFNEARMLASNIESLGTTDAVNFAKVAFLYISVMDTSITKNILKRHRIQLENRISDNNYLYSGLATTLYEYAFDTILPKYTPLFEEEICSKFIRDDNKIEMETFIVYPNPTDGYITISIDKKKYADEIIEFINKYGSHVLGKSEDIIINIYNTKSQLVGSYIFKDSNNMNINIKNFAAGTYILEINGCYGNVYQTKIIKL